MSEEAKHNDALNAQDRLSKIAELTAPGQELGISAAIDLICDVYRLANGLDLWPALTPPTAAAPDLLATEWGQEALAAAGAALAKATPSRP